MTPSTTSRNFKRHKLLRAVIPLAFWLGVWQLAAFLVDLRTNGHGALLLPYPMLVAQRLRLLAVQPAFWQAAAVTRFRALSQQLSVQARLRISTSFPQTSFRIWERDLRMVPWLVSLADITVIR